MSEMKDSRLYTRSLLACQGFTTGLYITVGIVVYYFCGQFVASPALGSAGPLIKRIAYGLGLPALLVSGILYTHVPAKWIFLSALKGTKDLNNNTPKHWIVWLGCVAGCVLFSYVIASAIPVFGGLVGLVGALFGTFLCTIVTVSRHLRLVSSQNALIAFFLPQSSMWFHDNWSKRNSSMTYKLLTAFNAMIFILGAFVTVAGVSTLLSENLLTSCHVLTPFLFRVSDLRKCHRHQNRIRGQWRHQALVLCRQLQLYVKRKYSQVFIFAFRLKIRGPFARS